MRYLITLYFLLVSTVFAGQKQLVVGVVDTGLDLSDVRLRNHLCQSGHKDFTRTGIKDNWGHGTHIVGLIEEYAKNSNYCIRIYKYTDSNNDIGMTDYLGALKAAVNDGSNIINISTGGAMFSETELALIMDNPKIIFVVSAGNDGKDLNVPEQSYYPAKYKKYFILSNLIPVGSRDKNNKRHSFSNYGWFIKDWEDGYNVTSEAPKWGFQSMTGTSQATAIKTGKLIYDRNH